MVGRRNSLYSRRIMAFVDLANKDPLRFEQIYMRHLWKEYKVWIIIGLAYMGFYAFKGYKTLKHMVSAFYTKWAFLHSLLTKES
jgi:hypothetical protein